MIHSYGMADYVVNSCGQYGFDAAYPEPVLVTFLLTGYISCFFNVNWFSYLKIKL